MLIAPVLGHQGGWDELLLVGGPIAVFALLLWFANRKARAQMERAAESGDADQLADGEDSQ
jgi:hypothetical protein